MPEKPNLNELIKAHYAEVQRIEKIKAVNEFYESLLTAVENSGGCTDWINEETTIKDLSDILSINNVRFCYKEKDKL